MALLELRNVSKFFGSLAALENISLEINQGELVGLVGPNGSGKTTLFNVVSGFYRPSKGEIIYDGRRITGLRPDKIASMGLARTFQSNIFYGDATVMENVIRGCYLQAKTNSWQTFFGTRSYREEDGEIVQRAREVIDFLGLSEVQDSLAGELPHGHQRCLGLAIAMAANPKLLLLDEPATGMNDEERRMIIERIGEVAKLGITILLVEHHLKTVVTLCPRLIVLDFGHKLADGKPEEVTSRKDVIEAYLGVEEVTE